MPGRPLAGYEAAECVVKRDVGLALARVQRELAPTKRSLKMLDCYRPAGAVHDMVVWARNGRETPAERRYNPAFSKKDLFRLGYVAEHSGHSTGVAVDLTLVDLTAGNSAAYDPDKAYADCTAPARQGFVNYSKEWWHFSLPGAAGPAYDFPVTARHN